ncbi:MAG: hypothetical protein JST73_02350, partial [Actinobacteria bacterium]|nr:hypothetical protein [Actinomycetota bacterium]
IVVTHGGIIYALEAALGAERRYLPNLGARWIELRGSGRPAEVTLGDRIHLYDQDVDAGEIDSTPSDAEAV